MTDLMQTAVNIGTGRAAQIGRPVAGKTGTTSSNKDGWFLGFSSGITTGVWMGRDDAKPVPGLQGGTAPARAFAQYMRVATAGRPVQPFDTQLKLPEWQLQPDDEANPGNNPNAYYYNDDQGNLVPPDNGQGADGTGGQGGDNPPAYAPVPRAARPDPSGKRPLFDTGDSGNAAANTDFLDNATGAGGGKGHAHRTAGQ